MPQLKLTLIGAFFTVVGAASAKPPFLKVLVDTYKIGPNSALGKARCLSCHQAPAPPKLNPFGQDVESAMKAVGERMLTAEILKSVEKKDSDKDRASNLAELRAGTLPGEKGSKPGKPPKVSLAYRVKESLLAFGLLSLAILPFARRSKTPYNE